MFFEKKVNVRRLLDEIYFTEENVKNANLNQASLQLEAARYFVQMKRERLEKELTLKNLRARKAIRYRKTLRENGKAPTEGTIRERLDRNEDIFLMEAKVNRAIIAEDYARQISDVFKQRQSAIKVTAELRKLETAGRMLDADKLNVRKRLKDVRNMLSSRYHKDEDEDE